MTLGNIVVSPSAPIASDHPEPTDCGSALSPVRFAQSDQPGKQWNYASAQPKKN